MGIDLLQNPAVDCPMSKSKRKRKRRQRKKMMEKNALVTANNIDESSKVRDEKRECTSGNCDSGKNPADTDSSMQPPAECPTMAAGSTENLSEVGANLEKRTKSLKKKKAKRKHEARSRSISQLKMDTDIEPTKKFAEGKMNEKQKNRPKNAKKEESQDEANQADEMSNLHLSEGGHGRVIDGKPTKNKFTAQNSKDVVEVSCVGVSSGSLEETPVDILSPTEVEEKSFPCGAQHCSNSNRMNVETLKFENKINESNEIVVSEEKCLAGGGSVLSTCDVESTTHVSFPDVMDFRQCPQIAQVYSRKRKLLVLDVNGLLAEILFPAPKNCRGDAHILGRAVFKRPFCDDFLKFCFQNFDVGIWSSRSKKLIDRVVEYLLGDLQEGLLFCWDMLHSTQTGFKTLENRHKPLVCKELRKIWESDGPNLHWKKGQYNETNTLLLDDSPYKALLNPLHTAIFPNSYSYMDKSDNSLGLGGDLRVYLEGLLACENVQKYVEQHPFGQSAINETSSSWGFYSQVVLQTKSIGVENSAPNFLPSLPILS